jgi:hypothetical protein
MFGGNEVKASNMSNKLIAAPISGLLQKIFLQFSWQYLINDKNLNSQWYLTFFKYRGVMQWLRISPRFWIEIYILNPTYLHNFLKSKWSREVILILGRRWLLQSFSCATWARFLSQVIEGTRISWTKFPKDGVIHSMGSLATFSLGKTFICCNPHLSAWPTTNDNLVSVHLGLKGS